MMRLSVDHLETFLQSNVAIDVYITDVDGSSPREAGAWMLVSMAETLGTIGGGQLEYMMIDEARKMLRHNIAQKILSVPLGPEIGQCCGGRVKLSLSLIADRNDILSRFNDEMSRAPHVLIFGAGHVGKALARAMRPLPVDPILIDQRADELSQIDGVKTRLSPLPEAQVRAAPVGSAIVILTHDHALDFLIAGAALARNDLSYIGMIGSKTKRAVFQNWLCDTYDHQLKTTNLICPIGADVSGDKRPEVIAALVAAEIIGALDQFNQKAKTSDLKGVDHAR